MKHFCKTKIAFNRPLSLNVLLLNYTNLARHGEGSRGKKERREKKSASLFSFIYFLKNNKKN